MIDLKSLRQYFFSGLAVITPIVLTIYVLGLIVKLIDIVIGRYVNSLLKLALGFTVPGLHIIISIIVILLIGVGVHNFLAGKIMAWFESWILRLPLVGSIYSSVKKISEYFFSARDSRHFGKVVLVPYPREGVYAIGFMSASDLSLPNVSDGMVAVFVPTSPSPLTGFLEFFPKGEIIELDLTVEEALRAIVSGGVVVPDKWRKVNE